MNELGIVNVLRLVKKLEGRAVELFNADKPASYFTVYDALLHVSEFIEGELGIYLNEDGEVVNKDNEPL